ncbi:uncharacterized protein [Montipora capricornis]|uniref:uncharacterized protein n=1 Tax=Montipora capricornis TaxID=246305 RepID=UPI0035F18E4C
MAKGCMQRSGCYVEGCGKKHMTVLHPPVQPLPVGHGTQDSRRADQELGHSESSTSGVVTQLSSQSHVIGAGVNGQNGTGHIADKVRLRIVPVRVRGNQPGKVVETYALLDNGSDVTLCDRKLVDELGITGQPRSFMLTTQESKNSERSGLEVKLIVGSINGDSSLEVPRAWTVDRLNISECSIPRDHDVTKWPHLNGIELPEIDGKEVRVLIGCNVPEAFWVLEERRGGRGEPVAIRSLLGWTLIGPTVKVNEESSFSVNFVRLNDESDSRDETLLLQVKNFWETDFADSISSSKVAMSVEDERALAIMESSVRRVSGRYQVALPWRRQPPYLPNNRVAVEQRLSLLKKRFHRDPEFFARYKAAVNDYIGKGYAKQVPVKELYPNGRPSWYLPHHAVFHPHKPDKLRVVFDCAARFKGTSLNDQLLHGPDLTNSLFGVLQRFRQEPVALVSDIEAMFHQVKVDPLDSDALRFLWWPNDDLSAQPIEYRMEVHLFGSTSSPSCANFCIRKTAQDNIGNFSHQVIDTVLKNFHVDDCLKSVQSSCAVIDLRSQLCELLQKGGFRLTKWSCNSKDVLETIPNADRAPSIFDLDLKAEELPIERTLGVQWSMETDMFIFKLLPKDKPYTRRGILSVTSSIYDPLGIISPVVLSAKKLIQDLCKQGLSWDEEIKEEEAIRWKKWLSELPKLSQISLARCLKPADFGVADVTELHHFADASQIAYGAVSYARFVNEKRNAVHCSFLVGKSRLAHVKPMTIPRLELSAAVVAVKLDRTLREEMEIKIDRSVFWSDSTAVLQYIKNEDKRFHTFVANRLAVIHDGSKPSQWNFVESARNPADDASRGLTPEELLLQDRWFKGPEFLWKLEESWPVPSSPLPSIPDQDTEIKSQGQTNRTTMVSEESNLNSMIQRYSSWYELKRGVAWLLRFREYIRRKCYPPNDALPQGELSLEELRFAELRIVKYVQTLSFPEIFSALQASNSKTQEKRALRTSGSSGSIYKLRPMLDKEGALRVGGRLVNTSLNYQSKHQLLLPYNHHLSRLLIMAHHQSVGHLGQEYVLTSLRKKYWIIKGRAAVRKVLSGCLTCRKQNSLRGQQMMADLPKERLTPGDPPFSYVGIDYFGPLFVKRGGSIVKHYGCLFSCLTLRATHIEVAESLETDSFISALRRFISRRGKPRVIISDNGTNLCGGERELREAVDSWNQQKINSFLHQRNIDWKFNPPGASHMGGGWSALFDLCAKF